MNQPLFPSTPVDFTVQQAKSDRDAFASLYLHFAPVIFQYVRRRIPDQSLAEDIVSDTFLSIAQHMRQFTGKSLAEFVAWAYRIATNKINALVRKSSRRKELLIAAAKDHTVLKLAGDESDDDHDRLDFSAVQSAILHLNPRQQSLIALRYFEDLTHPQIADILNLKPGAVRVALTRALAKLRKMLSPA